MNFNIDYKTSTLIFIAVLFIVYWNIGLFDAIDKRPQGTHQWAQCDRASVARNYADESMNFFLPRVHHRFSGTGITGMEFPFMNYSAAIGYKLFGFHESIYRILMMLVVSVGFISAFIFTRKILQNVLMSLLGTLLFILSPTLLFYTPNFIPDAASMGFILMAWMIFLNPKTTKEPSFRRLILLYVITTLACLIKVTSLISVITWMIILLLSRLNLFRNSFGIRFNKKLMWMCIFVFVPVITWYKYAAFQNTKYGAGYFLMHAKPASSISDFITKFSEAWQQQHHEYYADVLFYLLLAGSLLCFMFYKKANRLLAVITILLYAGAFAFFILMVNQFYEHDYYIITLLPAVLFHLILITDLVNKIVPNKIYYWVPVIAVLILITNVSMILAKKSFNDRYKKNSWRYSAKINDEYFDLEPQLRKAGIKKSDAVLSITDVSPNITLYLMNQTGINMPPNDTLALQQALDRNYHYAVINDSRYTGKSFLNHHLGQLILKKDDIYVYKLK